MIVSRKIKINSNGSFKYTGQREDLRRQPEAEHRQGHDHGEVQQGQVQGHRVVPAGYSCDVANFSAKYYGVNPQG